MNTEIIDKLLEGFTENGPVGCSAVIYHHGKKIYEGCAGYSNREKKTKADAKTIYRQFSVSKVFTATAAMQLFEQGRFMMSDRLDMYLPEYKNSKVFISSANGVTSAIEPQRPITLMDLMTMQAGFTFGGHGNATEYETEQLLNRLESKGEFTTRELAAELAGVPKAFHPGTGFAYSHGYEALAAFIEVLSGMSFSEYLKKYIFEPLELEHTVFFREDIDENKLAEIYTWSAPGQLGVCHDLEAQFSKKHKWESGGQGIISSEEDMARFAAMLSMGGELNGVRIIGRKTIDLMRTNRQYGKAMKDFENTWENGWPYLRGYGYGFGVRTLLDPSAGGINGSVGEFGWAGLAGTYLLADPTEELAIAYGHQIVGNAYGNNMEGFCHPKLRQAAYGLLIS